MKTCDPIQNYVSVHQQRRQSGSLSAALDSVHWAQYDLTVSACAPNKEDSTKSICFESRQFLSDKWRLEQEKRMGRIWVTWVDSLVVQMPPTTESEGKYFYTSLHPNSPLKICGIWKYVRISAIQTLFLLQKFWAQNTCAETEVERAL